MITAPIIATRLADVRSKRRVADGVLSATRPVNNGENKMAIISDRHDAQLSALLASHYPGAAFNTFLTAVKARLDSDSSIQQFRYQGDYTFPHVAQAVTRTRGV